MGFSLSNMESSLQVRQAAKRLAGHPAKGTQTAYKFSTQVWDEESRRLRNMMIQKIQAGEIFPQSAQKPSQGDGFFEKAREMADSMRIEDRELALA